MIDLVILDRTKAGQILSHPEKSKEVTHVISIYSPPLNSERSGYFSDGLIRDKACAGFHTFKGHKIALVFDDCVSNRNDPAIVLPNKEHVAEIIKFAEHILGEIAFGNKVKLLVHCFAGVSRSTAAAMIVLARILPREKIPDIFGMVRAVRDVAAPNTLMVELADTMLDLNGQLTNTLPAQGRTYGWP